MISALFAGMTFPRTTASRFRDSWHVQNGTPLDVLMRLGSWSDLRMVLNYAHHSPGYLASYAGNTTRRK